MSTYHEVRKILKLILGLNLLVAGAKIGLGLLSGSQSVLSDGIHSLSDGFTNVIGLVGIKLSSKPKDESHPYGHSKYESIFGLIIGLILLFLGVSLFKESLLRFQAPEPLEVNSLSFLIMLGTLFINITITVYERKKGKALDSQLLLSDARHTMSDIFISLGVILGLVLMALGVSSRVDSIISLVVVLFIWYASYEILRDNLYLLLDGKRIEVSEVEALLKAHKAIKSVHNIRSRGIGKSLFLDMHIRVDSEMTIRESHALEHLLRLEFKAKYGEDTDVLIHFEPRD